MSTTGNTRNRAGEAADQRRRADQAAGRCIDCREPSETQRCRRCSRRVEAATERYRGKGTVGPPTKLATDVTDLRYSLESLSRAHAAFAEARARGLEPRRQAAELAEPLAQLRLAVRLATEVLKRHGGAAPAEPRRVRAAPAPAPRGHRPSRAPVPPRAARPRAQLAFAFAEAR